MKPKLLAGLAVVALVAVGGAVAVTMTTRQATTSATATQQRLFPEVATRADDIRTIVIASKDATVRLARDGERWVVPEDVPSVDDGFGGRVGLLIVAGS